jgi:hypothetical protein
MRAAGYVCIASQFGNYLRYVAVGRSHSQDMPARPFGATLPVESLASPLELESTTAVVPVSPTAVHIARAVRAHGGHAAGVRLSQRERYRRWVHSLGWQSAQLMACVIDLSMLLAESSGAPLALVNTVTGLVLLIFTVDLSVRAFVYRRMLLKSPWAYFDITVVGASLILYLIGIAAEANEHVTSSRGVSASLRGLIVVLRWFRAARALAVMVKTSGTGTTAARQLTGQNKRRFVDLVSQ